MQNLQVTDIFTAGPGIGNLGEIGGVRVRGWCVEIPKEGNFLEVGKHFGQRKMMIEGEKNAEDTKVVLWL